MTDEELTPEKKVEGQVEVDPVAHPIQPQVPVQAPPPVQPESVVVEKPSITPEEFVQQSPIAEPPPVVPPPPVEQPPATMSCDEMRNKIIDLADQRAKLESGIQSLNKTKEIIPSETIDKAINESTDEQKKLDAEITSLFEKYTVCATNP